jgi:hypothetical protein
VQSGMKFRMMAIPGTTTVEALQANMKAGWIILRRSRVRQTSQCESAVPAQTNGRDGDFGAKRHVL